MMSFKSDWHFNTLCVSTIVLAFCCMAFVSQVAHLKSRLKESKEALKESEVAHTECLRELLKEKKFANKTLEDQLQLLNNVIDFNQGRTDSIQLLATPEIEQ